MDAGLTAICRGCLTQVDSHAVSLLTCGIRELYESCTQVKLPDEETDLRSQHLCQRCHKQCQDWHLFKTTCHDNEYIYWPLRTISKEDDHVDAVDGSGGEMFLKLDEDVEDLLCILEGDGVGSPVKGPQTLPMRSPLASLPRSTEESGVFSNDGVIAEIQGFINNTHEPMDTTDKEAGSLPFSDLFEEIIPIIHMQTPPSDSFLQNGQNLVISPLMEEPTVCDENATTIDQEPFPVKPEPPTVDSDMFDIPPISEFGGFDENLLAEVTSNERRQEMVYKELAQSLNDQRYQMIYKELSQRLLHENNVNDDVDFWVCPACDANLMDPEAYRDHLKSHLMEEVHTLERQLDHIGHSNEDKLQSSRKRRADPVNDGCSTARPSKASNDNKPKHSRKRRAKPACDLRSREPPSKSFVSEGRMRQRDMNTVQCPLCHESRTHGYLLEDHIKVQHKFKSCPLCAPTNVLGKQSFSSHVLRCHVERFACWYCFDKFGTEKTLLNHIKDWHSIDNVLKHLTCCPLCKESCSGFNLEHHLKMKHPESPNCSACGAEYQTEHELIKHFTSYHYKMHCCYICNDKLHSENDMIGHIHWHESQFYCAICKIKLKNAQRLEKHNEKCH